MYLNIKKGQFQDNDEFENWLIKCNLLAFFRDSDLVGLGRGPRICILNMHSDGSYQATLGNRSSKTLLLEMWSADLCYQYQQGAC